MDKNFKKDRENHKNNDDLLSNITSKVDNLKKSVKDLQGILNSLYKDEIYSNNNKLIFIKRGIDKLNSASKYILNLKFEKKESLIDLDKEAKDLYNKICKDVSELDNKLSKIHRLETVNKNGNYVGSLRNNLDNLKLGSDCLKRMDVTAFFDKKGD